MRGDVLGVVIGSFFFSLLLEHFHSSGSDEREGRRVGGGGELWPSCWHPWAVSARRGRGTVLLGLCVECEGTLAAGSWLTQTNWTIVEQLCS